MYPSTFRFQIRVQHPTRILTSQPISNPITSITRTRDVPFRIRTGDLLSRSEQHGLVPLFSLLRSVDRLEHELAVLHLLRRLGVESNSVHDWFEVLREELSEESDLIEMRRHDTKWVRGDRQTVNAIES